MYTRAKAMLREVAREYWVSVPDILSQRRRKWQVIARHEAMLRMREELQLSYPEISLILKRGDHTSAMYGVKKARERRKEKINVPLDR